MQLIINRHLLVITAYRFSCKTLIEDLEACNDHGIDMSDLLPQYLVQKDGQIKPIDFSLEPWSNDEDRILFDLNFTSPALRKELNEIDFELLFTEDMTELFKLIPVNPEHFYGHSQYEFMPECAYLVFETQYAYETYKTQQDADPPTFDLVGILDVNFNFVAKP